jgi:putative ABC transport system permease protein
MRSLILQTVAVATINLKSIGQRFWLSFSTVIAVALAVTVLLSFLAMANGFRRTLEGAGSPDVAVLLRDGSRSEINSVLTLEQMRLIEEAPGVARRADGKPLMSAELYLAVDGVKRSTQSKASLPLRGLTPEGLDLRKGVSIVEGRMFSPGANEIVVGRGLLSEFQGFDIGQTIKFGTSQWTVVGTFTAGGGISESEIWADLPAVQSLFKRSGMIQTIRARLTAPEALTGLKAYNDNEPRLKLDVKSEAEYFADQASATADLIQNLGWPLAIAMALGALAGALNTMYSSVTARAKEIATLRAIGFGGFPAFAGAMIESLALAAIGGVTGALITFLMFDGFTASVFGESFTQVVFRFQLSPHLIVQGVGLALCIGFAGGLLPAIRAARTPIVVGLAG